MSRDVFLILAEFGRSNEAAALNLVGGVLERLFSHGAVHTVVVDNALALQETVAGAGYISGDNSLREFSAWDRGLTWLDDRCTPEPDAFVVLANDTVVRPDKRDRIRALPAGRINQLRDGGLVGWVEEYPRPVELFGFSLRHWVDTSFVISTRRTLATLGPLARPSVVDVFTGRVQPFFHDRAPLGPRYRAYLRTYFFGESLGGEFDQRWYGHEPLTDVNLDAFRAKISCVFCEHLLSARALASGFPLIDIRPRQLVVDRLDAELTK